MRQLTPSLTLAIIVVVLAACASRQQRNSNIETNCCVTNFAVPADGRRTSYFPAGLFQPDVVREKGFAESYSRSLKEMAEPSFQSMVKTGAESYRFLWLRSFHPGVAIRVWKCDRGYCLATKQLDSIDKVVGKEIHATAKLAIDRSRALTADEWNSFIDALNLANFWSLATVDGAPLANDGAEWVLEGAKESQYHVIARQSPDDGYYYEACLYLIKLSELKVDGELY
jgi:hypothetical protein